MTKEDLLIIRQALKILENEYSETGSAIGYKSFLFMGNESQSKAFYVSSRKADILSSLEKDKKYDNVWYVKTEEVDVVQYDNLSGLRNKILETVK